MQTTVKKILHSPPKHTFLFDPILRSDNRPVDRCHHGYGFGASRDLVVFEQQKSSSWVYYMVCLRGRLFGLTKAVFATMWIFCCCVKTRILVAANLRHHEWQLVFSRFSCFRVFSGINLRFPMLFSRLCGCLHFDVYFVCFQTLVNVRL